MSIMERLFGKPTPAQAAFVGNGPANPNLGHDPNDPNLTAQQRQAAIQAQGQQAQQQPGATNAPKPDAAAMNNNAPGTQTSPLDSFEKLWETPTIDPKAKPRGFVYPKFDAAKLTERVSQLNFASAIPDEMISKAMSDPAAFREVLNTVGRQGFQTAFTANNNLNSQLFSQFDDSVNERIPAQVKGIQNQAAVFADMKNLNHPAVAPLLSKVAEQIQQMFPDATPDEIKDHSRKYLKTIADVITNGDTATTNSQNSQQNQRTNEPANRITDFSKFDA